MATMPKLKEEEEEAMLLQGQANILHYTYNFVESMALKCAVELGIADIINSHGQPLTVHRSNHSTNCLAVHRHQLPLEPHVISRLEKCLRGDH
ncbi:putative (R,S)-reticuline 7-O-methyltransferase [Rosa chinensis]|uniref:Putative (R,S)-reticuline 7-O-methyltransferase n=1 Tax=Rosa chinensis TaxID=74649 RepID=A0A2P6S320_ROSCH|nr:putative (R,S)-reticuline 7-O-methyltransferase [Rosa chinensis]